MSASQASAAPPCPIATIDVGTNTTLLLVARARPGAPIAEPEVLAERYARIAQKHGATIAAIGTEALRRAPNADAFLDPAARVLGTPVEVITGDREAALTFRAIAESFPAEVANGRIAVVDIGGGSTEIIVADRGSVVFRRSLPLGSVRLHER